MIDLDVLVVQMMVQNGYKLTGLVEINGVTFERRQTIQDFEGLIEKLREMRQIYLNKVREVLLNDCIFRNKFVTRLNSIHPPRK